MPSVVSALAEKGFFLCKWRSCAWKAVIKPEALLILGAFPSSSVELTNASLNNFSFEEAAGDLKIRK